MGFERIENIFGMVPLHIFFKNGRLNEINVLSSDTVRSPATIRTWVRKLSEAWGELQCGAVYGACVKAQKRLLKKKYCVGTILKPRTYPTVLS